MKRFHLRNSDNLKQLKTTFKKNKYKVQKENFKMTFKQMSLFIRDFRKLSYRINCTDILYRRFIAYFG